ncbi:MAG TPA: SDR family oxidoreductase [Pyrinomonadaceae bacterium]|jgi:3-oxoacyl-[acyl-carrier protein] reductase|nr:SDR family oxidoreductase [Pyrinomonadaceae bacterium]
MQNFFDFTGKVVLVTGASSGIGRATAEFFGRCGASVAISYLKNKTGADEAVAAISGNGVASFVSNPTGAAVGTAPVAAMAVQADVTHNAEISRMIREVEEGVGPVDILVNNAGSLVERLKTLDLTEERWTEVMDLNATSAFFAAKAVIPKMLEKGKGVIVNVTSIAARNGGAPGSIHYSSAKAAMLTMTKGLAKEFASQGIRVNAVSPGVIDTPYHETFTAREVWNNMSNVIPMGRVGRSEEVASVIGFLASDAASYICGETIEINGGLLMD